MGSAPWSAGERTSSLALEKLHLYKLLEFPEGAKKKY